jgi:hypothetical protein
MLQRQQQEYEWMNEWMNEWMMNEQSVDRMPWTGGPAPRKTAAYKEQHKQRIYITIHASSGIRTHYLSV